MARVYLAERTDGSFRQSVAIKVLRAELDAPTDAARFRREGRLLSALDHPNIARLLDAGVAPGGRPYLVLEYIDGEPLLDYCNARHLAVRRRLQLFLGVAEAVEAAHHRLILHRDIKPGNVMVGSDGRVRLLDFGVSRLLEGSDDEEAATRGHWLTPEYASPEQLRGETLTSASDVYQLGALLYELLSGSRAYRGDASDAGRTTADPPPPSSHAPQLRGDLDAVVLKAMRASPADRYASANELAADVRRFLAGEPVSARAADRWYRWRRWTSRHALLLTASAALLLAAAGYMLTLAASRRRIESALNTATTEREKAREVTDFLLSLFKANDPLQPAGDTVSARTLLQRGVARVDSLHGQPDVQSELLQVIGVIQRDLGSVDSARQNLARALAIRRQLQQSDGRNAGTLLALLGNLDLERASFDTAQAELQEALALLGTTNDTSEAALSAQYDLAIAHHERGERAQSQEAFDTWERRAVSTASRRSLENAERLYALGERAEVFDSLARAERMYREALSIFVERLGASNLKVADAECMLADVEWRLGKRDTAQERFARALEALRAAGPAGKIALAKALASRAENLSKSDEHDGALADLSEALGLFRADSANNSIDMATTYEALARAEARATKYEGSVAHFMIAEREYRRLFGPRNALLTRARLRRADAMWSMGRSREGESILVSTYRAWVAARGATHPTAVLGLDLLTAQLEREGRTREAEAYRAAAAATPNERRPTSGAAPR